ncbi:MAG: ferritin-like domain-containing protein, partial [Bacteroidota bacterium]|nr:ferritin-like domain-containing protein [Bacteroidota bacterium]
MNRKKEDAAVPEAMLQAQLNRRSFLRLGGMVGASVALVGSMSGMTGCKKDDNNDGINLGSGDIGVLNYAYALEQLEAAFYTQAVQSQFSGITAAETAYL